jgi:hypothetical protein
VPGTAALLRFAEADLPSLLAAIQESSAALAAVAACSYRHDNGFAKIVLAPHDAVTPLRLHIWSDDGGDVGNVHNHCWDFTSLVLSGGLHYEEFTVDDERGVPAQHFAYESAAGFDYDLRRLGNTRLVRLAFGVREPGDVYEMTSDTLHRTWGRRDRTTVTLLARGPRRRSYADVHVTSDVPATSRSVPFSPLEIREHLTRVRHLLATEPYPPSRRVRATLRDRA